MEYTQIVTNSIIFLLNTFKNSQFINLIIVGICYIFIFGVIISGFFFTFYGETFSSFIVGTLHYFVDTNSSTSIYLNGDGMIIIDYYIAALFIIGICYEFILTTINMVFKKDFRGTFEGGKFATILILISCILVIEVVAAFLLKEWWLSLVGISSSIVMIVFYLWYRFVQKIVNKIKNHVQPSSTW